MAKQINAILNMTEKLNVGVRMIYYACIGFTNPTVLLSMPC